MSHAGLTTYLNDHLAGSVAALELLDDLLRLERGKSREPVLFAVRTQVEEDQQVLKALINQIGSKESRVRQVAAWLTEKLAQAKLRLDDPGSGELRIFEALETVALGIQGKYALWRALSVASASAPLIRHLDFAKLEKRALEQFQQVDLLRLETAAGALSL
jgi:hypothetical protein